MKGNNCSDGRGTQLERSRHSPAVTTAKLHVYLQSFCSSQNTCILWLEAIKKKDSRINGFFKHSIVASYLASRIFRRISERYRKTSLNPKVLKQQHHSFIMLFIHGQFNIFFTVYLPQTLFLFLGTWGNWTCAWKASPIITRHSCSPYQKQLWPSLVIQRHTLCSHPARPFLTSPTRADAAAAQPTTSPLKPWSHSKPNCCDTLNAGASRLTSGWTGSLTTAHEVRAPPEAQCAKVLF